MKPRFFIDRGLGYGIVPNAIKEAGYEVVLHDDLFAQDTKDIQWMTEVGKRNLVILSKDMQISKNPSEAMAIFKAKVFAFLLNSSNSTGKQNADAFLKALPDIENIVNKDQPPAIYRINLSGKISKVAGYEKLIDLGEKLQD